MEHSARLFLGVPALLFLLAHPGESQDVARFYEENCSACHTIGGGVQAGPDLKGVTGRVDRDLLIRFILDPERLVKAGDPYAVKIVGEWEDNVMPATDGMTPAIAEALLRYIDEQGGSMTSGGTPADVPVTSADIETGRRLFVGAERLSAGGPPCLACHRLEGLGGWNGGRFGPDLTTLYARLRGSAAVAAWLANPPTPVMKAVYQRGALAASERDALAALVAQSAGPPSAPIRSADVQFASAGAAGALLGAVVMTVVWRRRFRAVRGPFVAAARRSVAGDQR